jgi:hypothetical protein
MITIKDGMWSVVAGAVSVIALCTPTDMGAELSATRVHKAADRQPDQVARWEPTQSVGNDGLRLSDGRLEFIPRGLQKPSGEPVGADTLSETARAEPTDRRSKQLDGVPTTLRASAAPPYFPKTIEAVRNVASAATIRALQGELTRHGCYSGLVDGDWGPASRYAAATFIEAVNAKLPIDQPSEFLLALAHQHPSPACRRTSNIVTASTAQGWRATAATTGLADPSVERPPTAIVSAYAPHLRSPPRIVRANGGQPTIGLTTTPEMPLPPPGERHQKTQMALGAEPSSPSSESNPVTRDSTSQQRREAARRAAARNRQRQTRKRASRKKWKRQVYQSINLSGS